MIKTLLFLTRTTRYRWNRFTYSLRADKSPIQALRNRYKDCPMILCGSGPSLKETPLDDFVEVPAIGMNKIDLLFSKVKWRPSLILCTNNLVVRQHWKTFVHSEIPVYLSWKSQKQIPRPYRNKPAYFLSLATRSFSEDLAAGVGSAGTVTYTALQFAYYMGANPVILVGVDHNFICRGRPNDIVKCKGEDVNHFDPNYFANGQFWGVPNLELSELAYRYSKQAFEKKGRTIYDATVGGKLTIFPKLSMEGARELCARSLETFRRNPNPRQAPVAMEDRKSF